MFANLFQGLFDTDMTSVIAISDFLLCVGSALVVGLILAAFYMYQTRYTKSFVATLALLPAVVCVVIMMVNGNIGTGVASRRCVQPCSVSLCTRFSKGNWRNLPRHGHRIDYRDGIYRLCVCVCAPSWVCQCSL